MFLAKYMHGVNCILLYGHSFLQKYAAPEWEEQSLPRIAEGLLLKMFKTLNVVVCTNQLHQLCMYLTPLKKMAKERETKQTNKQKQVQKRH